MTDKNLNSSEKKKEYNRKFQSEKRAKLKALGLPQGTYNKESNTQAVKRARDIKKALGYENKSFSFVPAENLDIFEKMKNKTGKTDTALLSMMIEYCNDKKPFQASDI